MLNMICMEERERLIFLLKDLQQKSSSGGLGGSINFDDDDDYDDNDDGDDDNDDDVDDDVSSFTIGTKGKGAINLNDYYDREGKMYKHANYVFCKNICKISRWQFCEVWVNCQQTLRYGDFPAFSGKTYFGTIFFLCVEKEWIFSCLDYVNDYDDYDDDDDNNADYDDDMFSEHRFV